MDMYIIIKKAKKAAHRFLSIAAWTKGDACATIVLVKLSSL